MMFAPPGYVEHHHNRRFGKYRGVVRDVSDPEMRGRVKVSCPDVYGDDVSPWALVTQMTGVRTDSAFFAVPPLESMVWVEFEQGLPEYPIVTGGFVDVVALGRRRDGTPLQDDPRYQEDNNPLPANFKGFCDGLDIGGGIKGADGAPESVFRGEYPHVRGWQTPAGHKIIVDDTPGAERVEIRHRLGAGVEILPDGTVVVLSGGNRIDFTQGSQKGTVAGDSRERVEGNKVVEVGGDYVVRVGGAYSVDFRRSSGGATAVDDRLEVETVFERTCGGAARIRTGGPIDFAAADGMSLSSASEGSLSFADGLDVTVGNLTRAPDLTALALRMGVIGGRGEIAATDPTGVATKVGMEWMSTSQLGAPVATVGQLGPFLRLGDLRLPMPPEGIPGLVEPVVMGTQLQLYLTQLHSFLTTWLTDYLTHAHPWFSPSYTSAAMAGILVPQLQGALPLITPSSPKARPPILSDIVYVTR